MRAMNYKEIYESIILRAKTRQQPDCYTEKHHVVPRCMGGDDNESNLAILTPEEHYVCHQLLVKIYPNSIKLLYAARCMCYLTNKGPKRNNKFYGWLRRKITNGVIIRCLQCDKQLYVPRCMQSRKFCSKKCKGYYMTSKFKLTCKHCFKEFSVIKSHCNTAKYCSRACHNATNNTNFTCIVCSTTKVIMRSRFKDSKKYCSVRCANTGKKKDFKQLREQIASQLREQIASSTQR